MRAAVRARGDPGGAGDDLARVADRGHLDHDVDVVALDLPRDARERHQVVGDDDDLLGVHRVGEGEAEQAAGGRSAVAGGVAEGVGGGGGDHRDVNPNLAVLDRLPAPAVRAQDAEPAHPALRAVVTERAVHRAFDVVQDTRLEVADLIGVDRERRRREPHQVLHAERGGGVEDHVGDRVAVPEVVVARHRHAVGEADLFKGLAD